MKMNADLNEKKGSVCADAVGNPLPTALAMHDLSCLGRCALTVVLPTLSAAGVQAVPIPTVLLSTQTDGFEGYYFEDLTEQMCSIARHLKEIDTRFDAIYTGFLGSEGQIDKVGEIIKMFSERENGGKTLVLVDPVMGDNGRLYDTYTPEMMLGMRRLIEKADVITPNITEACFLTDSEYVDTRRFSKEEVLEYASGVAEKLKSFGVDKIAITGLHYEKTRVATYSYDASAGECLHGSEHIPCSYPGTGDLFASVMLGFLLNGVAINDATERASKFVKKVIKYTAGFNTPIRNGALFEPFLGELKP